LPKVLYGLFVVRSPVKMHCKFSRDFSGVFAVERLAPFPYSLVQLGGSECREPIVQNVLIQSVYEAVPAYCLSVR
jgi:hypothetical protein